MDGIEATANAASEADSAAPKAKDIAILRLEKCRDCQVKVHELKDELIEAFKQHYHLALGNDELLSELKGTKDDCERRIRELTPRHLARDRSNQGA